MIASEDSVRNGSDIIAQLLTITNRMLEQRHDEDFLIDGLQKRQALIDEYESIYKDDPEARGRLERDVQLRQSIEKIMTMDKTITDALKKHKNTAQSEVASNNSQQRLLGYINNAISASGSYMDYKK